MPLIFAIWRCYTVYYRLIQFFFMGVVQKTDTSIADRHRNHKDNNDGKYNCHPYPCGHHPAHDKQAGKELSGQSRQRCGSKNENKIKQHKKKLNQYYLHKVPDSFLLSQQPASFPCFPETAPLQRKIVKGIQPFHHQSYQQECYTAKHKRQCQISKNIVENEFWYSYGAKNTRC